jgi:hypothetical protein
MTRVALAAVPEDFPTGGSFLTGRIVGFAADSVVLRVPVTRGASGFGTAELRQDLYIPRSGIMDVERREVSGVRTGLAVAGAAGAGAALLVLIIKAYGSPSDGPGEGPDQMRIPWFPVPLR